MRLILAIPQTGWNSQDGFNEANKMNRFKDIICVVTEVKSSKIALHRAVSLAENSQARLTVICVTPHISIGLGMSEGGPISAELQEAMVKTRAQELEAMVDPYRGQMKIQTRVLVGVQFLEIIREVLSNGRDLVIKASEIQEWLDHLLGSEDMHLLRKCPCPVWLIKPAVQKSYRRILAAVDVNDVYPPAEKKARRELNLQILEMASSVALVDFAELHIVHAWHATGESVMRGPFMHMPEAKVNAYVTGVRQQREASLNDFMQMVTSDFGQEVLDYVKPQSHLVKGRAPKEISALAKKLEADLVVMGTVARTGIPGFITGNTAESILSQIDCSVMAIKPPGFKTPVTLGESAKL